MPQADAERELPPLYAVGYEEKDGGEKQQPAQQAARQPDRTLLPRAVYAAVRADPELLRQHPAIAEAFLATPWLLPHHPAASAVLNYGGLHNDLDALLAARARAYDLSPAALGGARGWPGQPAAPSPPMKASSWMGVES